MTSTFDFLMVLYSIIIGIGMAQILQAVGNLIQGNKPVKLYWVHAAWVFFVFFLHIFFWFSAWQYGSLQIWTIEGFMMFVTLPVVLFVVAVISLPDIDPDRNYDMRKYYFRNRRWLHGLMIVVIVFSAANEYVLLDQHPFELTNLARGGAVLLLLLGFFSGNAKVHGFQIVTLFVFMGFFALTNRQSIGT